MNRRLLMAAACVMLGVATSLAVAWGLACFVPVTAFRGTVALDGDHLQPWLIRMVAFGSERTIWFEKGRIWSKSNVGPPGGSSAAVSCWSFATATRQDVRFVKGQVELPADVRAEVARSPQTHWGIADDRRGWPLPAFRAVVMGTMDPKAPQVYESANAIVVRPKANVGGQSLAEVRVLPIEPLWPGLLVNSAIGAGAWWVAISIVARAWVAVMMRWLKAGHCPMCGYDLNATGGTAQGCPECGWNRAAAPTL